MPLCLPTCCIKKCVRRDGDRNASVLHKWPSAGGVANIWKTNIKSVQTDFDLSKVNLDELFVCSDHFADDCFKVTDDDELTDDLLPDAAPTIFPKMATKRRRSSNEDGTGTGSDSSAMKIVVKRTVQNEWKINTENAAEQTTSPLTEPQPVTIEEPKIKPQPIVLRMRRKSKKNSALRMRNGNGSITKNPSLIQANAIKAKYENRRKHKFMSADRNVKPTIPVPEIPPWKKNTATNVIIIPHKFEITVPYGCNLCGHLAYNICDYVLHIKRHHHKEKVRPHSQSGQIRNQSNADANEPPFVQEQPQMKPLVQTQLETEPFVKSPSMVANQQPVIQGHQEPMIPPDTDLVNSNLNKSSDGDFNTSTDKSSSSDNKCNITSSSFESSSSFTPPKNKDAKKTSPSKVSSKLDAIVSNLMVARKESIESNETTKDNAKQTVSESNDVAKENIKSEIKQESVGTKWPATDNESTTETEEEQTEAGEESITVSNNSESTEFETSNSLIESPPKANEQSTEKFKTDDTNGENVNTDDTKIIPHKPGISMADYEHVKLLKLSKEVISIFEEAFDTFPYLSEADYESLSVITRVDIKDMEKIFETARIRNGISWEKHHIIAAASSLGKNKS